MDQTRNNHRALCSSKKLSYTFCTKDTVSAIRAKGPIREARQAFITMGVFAESSILHRKILGASRINYWTQQCRKGQLQRHTASLERINNDININMSTSIGIIIIIDRLDDNMTYS